MNSPSIRKPALATPRILHADSHVGIRLGAKIILRQKFCRLQFSEASDGRSALGQLRKATFDLLILDLSLPGLSGIDVLHLVKKQWPALPVLIYTDHDEAKFAPRPLAGGANGYLNKASPAEELGAAVALVLQGGSYQSAALAEQMAAAANQPKCKTRKVTLSRRENQILKLIVAGTIGKAAAEKLGLSQKTISTYRARIFRKLQIDSLADLMRYAMRQGLA